MLLVLPPTNQTCLATIRLLQVGKKVVKESRVVLLFATKPLYVARFTGQGKLVLQRVPYVLCMA